MGLNFGQNLFPPRGEMIASYNYIDLIQNQGYLFLYLVKARDETAAIVNQLISSPSDSASIWNSVSLATTTGFEKLGDDDYDLTVGATLTLKGKGLLEFITRAKEWATNGKKCNFYLIIRLRKYSGGSETEIAYGKSDTNHANNDFVYMRDVVELDIATAVTFKKGDVLRITVESWIDCDHTTNAGAGYGVDPTSRQKFEVDSTVPDTDTGKKTDFKLTLPIKLQI